VRKAELAKIDTLEEKLDGELVQIIDRMDTLRQEVVNFHDLDALQREGVDREARLQGQQAALHKKVDMIQDIEAAKENKGQACTAALHCIAT
jgi:hypothetical protein